MKSDDESENPAAEPSASIQRKQTRRRFAILDTFVRNQVSLRNFLSRYVISSHDIDDVAQETFLRAYQAEQKKEIEQPRAFLFQIAKNLVLSEFNRKSRKITDYIEDFEYSAILMDDENVEANLMAQQKLGIFCEAVATLSPQCRRVVMMKKVYGMSHKEISRRMGIAISTVEKHLVRGIRQCNAVVAERYDDVDKVAVQNPTKPKAQRSVREGSDK